MSTCYVPDCGKRIDALGLCDTHRAHYYLNTFGEHDLMVHYRAEHERDRDSLWCLCGTLEHASHMTPMPDQLDQCQGCHRAVYDAVARRWGWAEEVA